MDPPEGVEPILALLEDPLSRAILEIAGPVVCHLVGGAIRDRLALGESTDDWDVIVRERGETVAKRLAGHLNGRLVRLGGKRFAAYRVVSGPRIVDLWDREGTPVENELRRRDLTINSIALDLTTGEWVDPLAGRADLKAGTLRANAPERFVEDPLRTIRLLRFSNQLPHFDIEPGTVIAARSGVPLLDTVAAERVRQELDRTLGRRLGLDFGKRLHALDLFPGLWAAEGATSHPMEALAALVEVSNRLDVLDAATVEPPRPDALAALHHAVLLNASGTSPGRSDPSEPGLQTVPPLPLRLERLLSRRWIGRSTAALAERLLQPVSLPATDAEQRLFVHRHRAQWPLVAIMASLAAGEDGSLPAFAGLVDWAVQEGQAILELELLLDGHDLERDFGVGPGPRVGRLLRSLGEAQAVGAVRTISQARRWMADQLSGSLGDGPT